MIKLLGALLIVFAGAAIGFNRARLLSNRPRQIRRLVHLLNQLETEIYYGFTPLPRALARLAKQAAEPLSGLLGQAAGNLSGSSGRTVRECWQQAVDDHWPKTAMKAAERDILSRLGWTLGVTDRDDQIKHLRLAVSQLQSEENTAEEERKRYEKLWKSLGVLAGVLIVILLF